MPALLDCQSAFVAALLCESGTGPLPPLEEPPQLARRRLEAYRRNFFGNLCGALRASYRVVENIVGPAFFGEAARQYVLAHPSGSGDLNDFGASFDVFLAAYPHARHLEYLPDVARLEWLVQRVLYAPDAAPADMSVLAGVSDEHFGELHFEPAPDFARLDSRWPLYDIWRVNQPEYAGDMEIDFSIGAQLLILRRHGLVGVEPMSAAAAELLDALADGASLAHATDRAMASDNAFDLGGTLSQFVGRGLLRRAYLAPGGAVITG